MKAAKLVSNADFIVWVHHFATSNLSECITDSDCPDHLACGEDEECVDPPCDCAANAHCDIKNHTTTGICICYFGHVGDPYLEGCKGKQSQFHHFNVVRTFKVL